MGPANELGLYAFIGNILSQSLVIGGRFAVLKGAGEDINATNFGQAMKDALSGFTTTKKWPAMVMLPPNETESNNDKGWSTYKLVMYFLSLNNRTGNGDIKSVDIQTNMSTHTYQQDWKDMREVAGNFIKAFRDATRSGAYPIRENAKIPEQYRRVTGVGDDKLNGVQCMYEVQLWNGINCNPLADYPNGVNITVTNFNPHPLHKQ